MKELINKKIVCITNIAEHIEDEEIKEQLERAMGKRNKTNQTVKR